MLIDGGERHAERSLLGHQHAARAVAFDRRDIVVAGRAEMRRHENIEPKIAVPPRAGSSRHSMTSTSRRGSGVTRSRSV